MSGTIIRIDELGDAIRKEIDAMNQEVIEKCNKAAEKAANEGVEGYLLGAPVKIEDSVADDDILIGDPSKVTNNVITDILVETDKDIKAHMYIYSGYERSECALIDDKAFALLTVKASA